MEESEKIMVKWDFNKYGSHIWLEYLWPIDREKIMCCHINRGEFIAIKLCELLFDSCEEFETFKNILLRDFDEYGLTKLRFTETHEVC